MQLLPFGTRAVGVLTLAAAAALLAPGAALAATPSPTTGTATTTTASPTGSSAPTTSGTGTASPTTSGSTATGTPSPTGTTTSGTPTASATSGTTAPRTSTNATAPKVAATTSAADPQVPFGGGTAPKGLLPGGTSAQAGYAAGFMVRTLAARGHHYNYPGSTFFDGGNTIDAVLGLDGAGLGSTEAGSAFAYLTSNVGGYIGTDYSSLYAGPTGKALLAVVAQGGNPRDVGPTHLDLLAELGKSLGAAEPGRYSDLPVTGCGYSPCDYSNTIGQALDVIGVGRATGTVPQSAADYLLAQQCADGGFRGDLAAAGGACTSDVDATAFATQAVIGLLGASDPAVTKALSFLAARQAANGGFLNGDGQYNANTAGVAAQAFAAGGRTVELARAQQFLASLQLDCTATAALRGGIAFTAADRATLTKTPGTTAALDRALRATPQATLGLAGGDLLTVTSDGASTAAPAPSCLVAPSTSTSSSTTTAPAGSPPATTTAAPAPVAPAAASATPGSLAFTGADVAATAVLGLLLLLGGIAAIVLARRKGAHA
ncbi:prenyltransferase/squalene oxidase repeat-containing protein [Phycicoccus sp. 3266]|uniref:prenyltransferase/squalene oxidase repeat-containing protein n=1 Tax=Phycicoccus sp. 3266 TaxID=2817751 RepID=UPI00285B2810|nr:prenyltransferase/squalene oxidase repeat-containing protein [Phycicoccus sp. 3266]MDR6861827.1 hypothetical protein [Phycicoccus sp. 3266]